MNDINDINVTAKDIYSQAPLREPERQLYFIERCREFVLKIRPEGKPLMLVNTFGCQMNAHDSEKLKGMLFEMGYGEAKGESEADFIIYNTCCVRENAENKVYGNLGQLKHLKREKKRLKIALCGCMMQQETVIATIKEKYSYVDLVFGTHNLYKLPELLFAAFISDEPVYEIKTKHGEIVENLPSVRNFKYKASVNIMYGCDNFCSYCIVPYVRGRERSRKPEDILNEIKGLVKDGVKEVCLLGQNVNSYGKGLSERVSFGKLLRMVNDVEGLERIRFMTSHPKDLSDELIFAMRDCEKVCKHIHLPFQAGNDEILRKMNRHYTKEQYIALTERLKANVPGVAITTDIMVGFPGEYDVDDTVDIIKRVRFSGAFTFIYSKRVGTPAAKMDNMPEEGLVKENFNRVLEVLNPIIAEINAEKRGKTYKVLAEGISGHDKSLLTGRLEDNTLIHFKGNTDSIGNTVSVKVTDSKTFYLLGEQEEI
ncbi:MAG: tRNA (N6-isopentenyl adenosine(37)-C2)-methylthiotransferase MiaB [Clostridiales bacterium]|nr:tRNA (N6-isopentenyl adenosine(37)-C2)-methylthiotransferase MiaB [Clostridiales bacterium]